MNYDTKIPIVLKFASGVVKTAVDIVVEETVGSSVGSSVVSVLLSGCITKWYNWLSVVNLLTSEADNN